MPTRVALDRERARHTRDVHREGFVRLDDQVSVDGDLERIARLPRRHDDRGHRARDVISISNCCGGRTGAIGRRDVERHAAVRGSGDGHREAGDHRAAVAFRHRRVADRKSRFAAAMRRDREIVDGKTVVSARRVEIDPAYPEGPTRWHVETADDAADRCPVGSGLTIECAEGAGGRRRDEVERVDVDPRAVVQAGGIQAVLEIEAIDPAERAKPPLFARISDLQAADRRAGVVREEPADERDQAAALQAAERTIGARRRTEAIGVAGVDAAGSRRVGGVGVRPALQQPPPGRQDSRGARRRQRVEVLRVEGAECRQAGGTPALRPRNLQRGRGRQEHSGEYCGAAPYLHEHRPL